MKEVRVCKHCGVIIRKTAKGWRHIRDSGCQQPEPNSQPTRQENPLAKKRRKTRKTSGTVRAKAKRITMQIRKLKAQRRKLHRGR